MKESVFFRDLEKNGMIRLCVKNIAYSESQGQRELDTFIQYINKHRRYLLNKEGDLF